MSAVMKKGVLLLVVVFLVYYMFTNPSGAAEMSKTVFDAVWSGLQNLFTAVIAFLNAVFS